MSQSSSNSRTVLTVATISVIGGLAAYAVYFDYKRRNDVNFRKSLRKEKKKVDKTTAQTKEAQSAAGAVKPEELKMVLEAVKSEEVPSSPEDKEQYFMAQVGMGEQICAQGPEHHLQAAMCFYRALRVYPSPVELIVIYQKTVPEAVFKIIMEMTNLDVKNRVEGYYEEFPPKSMNVKVETVDVPDGTGKMMRKKILTVLKDFKADSIIYKEHPVTTVLDFDMQAKGTHCTRCFREIEQGMVITSEPDRLHPVYCSKDCQVKSKAQSQNLLFGSEPPIPLDLSPDMGSDAQADREAAQVAFAQYINDKAKAIPLLVARFIARQVAGETTKMVPGGPATRAAMSDCPEADGGEYTLYDHIERLRYLECEAPKDEMKLLSDVLSTAVPGLEAFVTDERHATLLGKMAYNSYGICTDGGRDDRPVAGERPEDQEKTRTPYGTSKQIGTGMYLVSAYASHSCAPSARPSFNDGTAELHLIASRDLKAGDEITVSYVDCTQHADESAAEARRRRRMELARGWRFACACSRCAEEAVENPSSASEEAPQEDESKVEESVRRVEDGPDGVAAVREPEA